MSERSALTWNTSDAEDVRVAHQETLQDVSGLVGVNDDSFGGGLGAGADPNQGGQLLLMPQLLLLILRAKEDIQCKKNQNTLSGQMSFVVAGNMIVFFKCQDDIVCTCLYLEFLVQFFQAALRSYFLFRALTSGHVAVKDAGSYDGTSVSGFPSREVHTSSTPQLKTQSQQSSMRYK